MAEATEEQYDSDNHEMAWNEDNLGNQQTNEDRDRLYVMREVHIDALNRFFAEIWDDEMFTMLDSEELSMRQERMQQHFNDLERAHLLYRQVCIIASDEIYTQTESVYMSVMSKVRRRLKELTSGTQISNITAEMATNPSMGTQGSTLVRFETPRVPDVGTFNGNPADWPAFRDLFIAKVHSKDIDRVQKLLYLKKACIEKAANTLGPWAPVGDNYQSAWDTMMAAYNDEYHVIHGILGRLFAVNRQEKESFESLREILDAITSATRQLNAMPDQSALADQYWIHIGKQRLPKRTLDSWEQHRNRHGANRLPTLDEFKQFLDSKAKGRREFEHDTKWASADEPATRDRPVSVKHKHESSNNRFKPYDKNASRYGSKSNPPRRNEAQPSSGFGMCIMPGCSEKHQVWACGKFKMLTLTDRLAVVRNHRLCRCCLQTGHMANQCEHGRFACSKCPDDKVKHHFRVCPKTTIDKKPIESAIKKEPIDK